MKKMKLAVLVGDPEYGRRFVNCIMNYYREQLEMHVFSGIEQWEEAQKTLFDGIVISDMEGESELLLQLSQGSIPTIYLFDQESDEDVINYGDYHEKGGICFVDKYQEVNKIVDEVMKLVGNEIKTVQESGYLPIKTRVYGVYSLSENEFQIPFAVTMASILSENEKVLVLDLQENSGFSQFYEREERLGLEEVFVMAQEEEFSKGRFLSCIGHLGKFDFIYPAENTECLCEATASIYLKIIQMISQEFDYDVLILNLGSRFQGFFEVINHCQGIYLMQRNGGLCQWREYEFLEELEQKGYGDMNQRIQKVQIPNISSTSVSCERLVEQWKWNELGDFIRRMSMGLGVMRVG